MQNDEQIKEESEVVDINILRKNREREEVQRAHEEFNSKKGELSALDANELTGILERLNKALDGGVKEHTMVLHLLREVDQSDFMIGFRRWWDARGSWTQRFLYNMHKFPMTMGALSIFRPLVSFGFLELKGVSPEQLTKMEHDELSVQKFAAKVLETILPEMRPFKPLLDILLKLAEKEQGFADKSRQFLQTERVQDKKNEDAHCA